MPIAVRTDGLRLNCEVAECRKQQLALVLFGQSQKCTHAMLYHFGKSVLLILLPCSKGMLHCCGQIHR
jgi:hypothetical protein